MRAKHFAHLRFVAQCSLSVNAIDCSPNIICILDTLICVFVFVIAPCGPPFILYMNSDSLLMLLLLMPHFAPSLERSLGAGARRRGI